MHSLGTQLFAVLLCFMLLGSRPAETAPTHPLEGPIKVLVIDPGHGGRDPGAVGRKRYEKDLTLEVALELRDLIQKEMPEIKVVMTREKDRFVSLHQRGKIAQAHQADFFLSIHCNSSNNPQSVGSESYVLGFNPGQESYRTHMAENRSILYEDNYQDVYGDFDPQSPESYIYFNLVRDKFRTESMRMADKVQRYYRQDLGSFDRGLKPAPFMVLWMSGIPGILTEIGFISNRTEEKLLSTGAGQKAVARCLFKAIQEYNGEF
ncbi:MAG: N-acetylmuramoyl-L-alanine amidase [Bacteroidota bacterium]